MVVSLLPSPQHLFHVQPPSLILHAAAAAAAAVAAVAVVAVVAVVGAAQESLAAR